MARKNTETTHVSGWLEDRYAVEIELQEPLLGTVPQRSIWAEHVASKQTKELKRDGWTADEIKEEIAATVEDVPELEERGLTSFMHDEKGYFIRDFLVRGFLKESARVLKEHGKLKQLQSKVSKYVYVRPTKLYVAKPKAKLEIIERPLRAQTPMGERTAIARSESVPAGTRIKFEIVSLQGVVSEGLLRTLLGYGTYQGLGQWRSSGCGRFEVVSFAKV